MQYSSNKRHPRTPMMVRDAEKIAANFKEARWGTFRDGVRVSVPLPNGGGEVSAVWHAYSHGFDRGLWEAAIVFPNGATSDPEGWLSSDDVAVFARAALRGEDPCAALDLR